MKSQKKARNERSNVKTGGSHRKNTDILVIELKVLKTNPTGLKQQKPV